MLNFFYLYAAIWSAVIFLYQLGWSDLCHPLSPELIVFFVITIGSSFFAGKVFEKYFEFRKPAEISNVNDAMTCIIVCFTIIELVYGRQIPVLAILTKKAGYTETFSGIPTFHVLLTTFGRFYAQYLIYLFVSFPRRKKYIIEYIIVVFCVDIIWFSRMGLILSLFMSSCIAIASLKERIRLKHMLMFIAAGIVGLYLFGVSGNLRQWYAAGDNSMIRLYGSMNNRYPAWLPEQFIWAYSYMIAPLANLNINIAQSTANGSLEGFLSVFVPDFIARRLFSGRVQSNLISASTTMTVIAGVGDAYGYGGIIGMYIMHMYMMSGQVAILRCISSKKKFLVPMMAIMCAVVSFTVYVNTLWYSAISFPLFYPLVASLPNKRIRIRRGEKCIVRGAYSAYEK
ncbi:hypothetical protein [Otoolea muris]|uniref:hypothetical protein n=1 Tax=Otoolea muris TaxID=2941515 RepID=UPI00203C1A23|nr:hypothetical protein [Otoolea muris]